MSEGYASKDDLLQLSRKPRVYTDVGIPGWGKITIHTINAGEFCRIDAAKNRAIMTCSGGDIGKQAVALRDYLLEIAKACISEPVFTDADRELLLSLDSSTANAIKDACLAHCSIEEASSEDAEKNSAGTSGDSSLSASGST